MFACRNSKILHKSVIVAIGHDKVQGGLPGNQARILERAAVIEVLQKDLAGSNFQNNVI